MAEGRKFGKNVGTTRRESEHQRGEWNQSTWHTQENVITFSECFPKDFNGKQTVACYFFLKSTSSYSGYKS